MDPNAEIWAELHRTLNTVLALGALGLMKWLASHLEYSRKEKEPPTPKRRRRRTVAAKIAPAQSTPAAVEETKNE